MFSKREARDNKMASDICIYIDIKFRLLKTRVFFTVERNNAGKFLANVLQPKSRNLLVTFNNRKSWGVFQFIFYILFFSFGRQEKDDNLS